MSPSPCQHQAANRLRGCIVTTYATYKGKRLGPYYVRSWKENGKQRREYIKPADLNRVREAIENHRIHKAKAREIGEVFNLLTANLNFLHTMARRSAKQVLELDQYNHLAHLENDLLTPNRPPLRRSRQTKRSIVLPDDVWRSIQRRTPKKSARNEPTKDFMYPFSTKNPTSPNPEIPSSALRVPSSNTNFPPHATPEFLAAKFAQLPQGGYELSHTSAKDYQASLPKRKKVTRYFFIRQGQGDPEREVNDVQVWIKSPPGQHTEDPDEIYEYYKEPNGPDDPKLTPETTWINPNYSPNLDLTTRSIYKYPWL